MRIHNILKPLFFTALILMILVSCSNQPIEEEQNNINEQAHDEANHFELISKMIYAPPKPLEDGSQATYEGLSYIKGKTPVIAYMPPGTEFDYYIAIGKGIESLANEYKANFYMKAPIKGSDIAGQMTMLEEVIHSDVDIIILSTHDENAAAPFVELAVGSGIQVVIINSDILTFPTPVHAVVGYNQRNGTHKLANYISHKVGDDLMNIGIIEGQVGWHSTERVGGFLDGIDGKKNFTVVASEDGKWNIEGGKTAARTLLLSHPAIQMIFAANDYEILGALEASEEMGRDDLLLYGNDGDTACLEAIAAGHIDATVHTAPYEMGVIALQVAFDGLAGTFNGGYVETPTIIVDVYSVTQYLKNPDRLYPKPLKDYNE